MTQNVSTMKSYPGFEGHPFRQGHQALCFVLTVTGVYGSQQLWVVPLSLGQLDWVVRSASL